MDAKLHGRQRKLKNRLPGQHVTGGVATSCSAARQAQAAAAVVAASGGCTDGVLHLRAIAHKCGMAFDPFDAAQVFKRTPYISDLKPAGRFVAKDLFDGGKVPLLIKTLLDNGLMHGECLTVTGCTMAETVNCVAWNPDRVRPADQDAQFEKGPAAWQPQEMGSGFVWKYAQQIGPARHGAVTHPVAVAEKACYADI
jgi:dihydroxy-acid dehydratase